MTDFLIPESSYRLDIESTGLEQPFWEAAHEGRIVIQRCLDCRRFQWGPEVICHHCHSFHLGFEEVRPLGSVHSWQRTWRGLRAVAETVPYVTLVVELDDAPGILLIGNLLGDQTAPVAIGSRLAAVFERHEQYSLIQWRAR